MQAAASVLAVALMLAWPALVNVYPIVFSDTYAFIDQASRPLMVWDKPWTYGPFLALHGGTTLWLPMAGQALILSHLLWLLPASRAAATPLRHLLLGVLLAAGSAAPWFASLLMPDVFAPVTVIALYLLAFPGALGAWQRGWLAGLATAAIAFHLSHLIVAAGCLAVILAMQPRAVPRAALPLGLALVILLVTNVIGHSRLTISPYGAVHALARMAADGNVAPVLTRECPARGWYLCAWRDRLPTDSDAFLWAPDGPVSSHPGHAIGAIGFAAEADVIVGQVLRQEPLGVLRAALANTARQLLLVTVGDTLGPDWLDVTVLKALRAYFPPEEQARFLAARQINGKLPGVAAPFLPLLAALLLLGTVASVALILSRADRRFTLVVLAGLLANAVATGALSGPHDRYQARIAWLVLLPPALALLRSVPTPRPRPETCGRVARSR
ncbi:MAG: hypothetical protein NT133_19705 [Alphaproteobacteria bacterium]|nr:hypothetical protein [Alphaproteobacteria bacterium]